MPTPMILTVNDRRRTVVTEPARTLLDVLREDLQLTGAKYGCGEARCGACSVLIDGKRAYACQTEVRDAVDKPITTIEGIAQSDALHPLQEAFLAEGAYQCGYCIPGMIVSGVALLKEKPNPTDQEITTYMNRHLCRCCGYINIQNAIRRCAAK